MRRATVGFAACAWLTIGAAAVLAQSSASPPPKDTIFARKTLMDTINANMDEIEEMLAPGGKLESGEAREHLDLISVLLQTFPHLFPPTTNQWKDGADRDAALDTYASPTVWASFDDFYNRAGEASKIAFTTARVLKLEEFKSGVAALRKACDSCHDAYMKKD